MENLYKAPEAELVELPASQHGPRFFVTSIRKMLVLYMVTMGIYTLYWGYKQWDSQRFNMGKTIWPVWRTSVLMFYTHSLCRLISQRLEVQQQPAWRYRSTANWYVLLSVVSIAVSFATWNVELTTLPWLGLTLVMLGMMLPTLIDMQSQANIASQDPLGESNSTYSGANVLCIILGSLFWLLALLGSVLVSLLEQTS